ncbi:MAG: phage tail protein [Hydrogenobacter thermophilus]|jgi:hypothetical protein|uniref:phage tail protein n=1 Tax=Hydrogenobacter thermophilus TaxID=940 RepID=UPI0030F98262|nr:phage tail protein [Hydrogenobacter thermophilus]
MADITPIVYNPKRRNLFLFEIDDIPPFIVVQGKRPSWSYDDVDIHVFNGKFTMPGKRNVDTIDLILNEPVDRDIVSRLYEWHRKVYDPDTGTAGYRAEYSKNIMLTILGYKGEELEVWLLEDTYPQAFQGGDLDMSSTDPLQITLTLKIRNPRLIRTSQANLTVGTPASIIV